VNKTWQVVLAFLVVFVAGGAIGSVFTLRLASAPSARTGNGQEKNGRPEEFGPRLVGRWILQDNQLNLTAEQKEKIRPIIWDAAEDLQRTRVETAHSATLLLENMQDRISEVLNPEQQNRFHQMVENQRERFQRFTRDYQRRALLDAQQAKSGGAGQ
jgi:Spy/CpxP family protein refolding chaperone